MNIYGNGYFESTNHSLASSERRVKSHKDTTPHCASGSIGSVSPMKTRDCSKPANVSPLRKEWSWNTH